MSDCRLGAPEGRLEADRRRRRGRRRDGTGNDVIAEIVASASFTREFLDTWRMPEERFAIHGGAFALTQAYVPLLGQGDPVGAGKGGTAPAALARVILDSPNPRAAEEIVRGMKLDPAKLTIRSRYRGADRRRACGLCSRRCCRRSSRAIKF